MLPLAIEAAAFDFIARQSRIAPLPLNEGISPLMLLRAFSTS